MTQLTEKIDEIIRYSDSQSRDRQIAHNYDLLLKIKQLARKLEDDHENILQQNEMLRDSICKDD